MANFYNNRTKTLSVENVVADTIQRSTQFGSHLIDSEWVGGLIGENKQVDYQIMLGDPNGRIFIRSDGGTLQKGDLYFDPSTDTLFVCVDPLGSAWSEIADADLVANSDSDNRAEMLSITDLLYGSIQEIQSEDIPNLQYYLEDKDSDLQASIDALTASSNVLRTDVDSDSAYAKTELAKRASSVNGVVPDAAGNIAISLASVRTGTNDARNAFAASEGDFWVVSGDSDTNSDGSSYIYDGDTSAWLPVGSSDMAANDARYVNTAGDTMTGNLSISREPLVGNHATTKHYVDSKDSDTLADAVAAIKAAKQFDFQKNPGSPVGVVTQRSDGGFLVSGDQFFDVSTSQLYVYSNGLMDWTPVALTEDIVVSMVNNNFDLSKVDSDFVLSQIPTIPDNQVDSDWVLSQIPTNTDNQVDSDYVLNAVSAGRQFDYQKGFSAPRGFVFTRSDGGNLAGGDQFFDVSTSQLYVYSTGLMDWTPVALTEDIVVSMVNNNFDLSKVDSDWVLSQIPADTTQPNAAAWNGSAWAVDCGYDWNYISAYDGANILLGNAPASNISKSLLLEIQIISGNPTTPIFTGGTVMWPGGTAPTLNDGISFVTLITRDGGTTWYGFVSGENML